jgi:IclR family pca regulon transcriptional regulator
VALNDEELTPGLSSVAAPVFRGSEVVGAVNVATLSARTNVEALKNQYGVLLRRTAREISADISVHGNSAL